MPGTGGHGVPCGHAPEVQLLAQPRASIRIRRSCVERIDDLNDLATLPVASGLELLDARLATASPDPAACTAVDIHPRPGGRRSRRTRLWCRRRPALRRMRDAPESAPGRRHGRRTDRAARCGGHQGGRGAGQRRRRARIDDNSRRSSITSPGPPATPSCRGVSTALRPDRAPRTRPNLTPATIPLDSGPHSRPQAWARTIHHGHPHHAQRCTLHGGTSECLSPVSAPHSSPAPHRRTTPFLFLTCCFLLLPHSPRTLQNRAARRSARTGPAPEKTPLPSRPTDAREDRHRGPTGRPLFHRRPGRRQWSHTAPAPAPASRRGDLTEKL
ncbi:hypothetical protein EV641_106176 [Rhodococcus sp. SMB37]|nr:hypothetical protein EV641_106176 [Rhodococcus sp. SMB37]